jgi:hypothetical protein
MKSFKLYVISIILYLCILWTVAQNNETVDIEATAKPYPKGKNKKIS